MNPTSSLFYVGTEVAASFWPSIAPCDYQASLARLPMGAATNLCELFEEKLSLLVAGACETDRMARTLFAALAPDQIPLRRMVLGLAQSARGCLPALPRALCDDGLALFPARDVVIHALLRPVNPARRGPPIVEPRSVTGARMVDAFTHVALHFEADTGHAADDARLLGSDGLHCALASWAAVWSDCLHDLRRCAKSFRMQAYAGDREPSPRWQTA